MIRTVLESSYGVEYIRALGLQFIFLKTFKSHKKFKWKVENKIYISTCFYGSSAELVYILSVLITASYSSTTRYMLALFLPS
jgi:hypothetical protein